VWVPEGVASISDPLPFAFASLPDPDTFAVGTAVTIIDECPFFGVVMPRPHLEANGSQRFFYRELVGSGYSWKPITATPVTINLLGRIDPNTGLLSAISSLAMVPNCGIGVTVGPGVGAQANRLGRPNLTILAPAQILVPGQNLTWNATGQLAAWTPSSPTPPVGFSVLSNDFLPYPSGPSLGLSFVSFLPFV
jgi:hypothetical protein